MHPSTLPPRDWSEVNRSLMDGDYHQALMLLKNMQTQSVINDDWHLHASAAIAQICQLCIQCQDAAEWHQQCSLQAQEQEMYFRQKSADLLTSLRTIPIFTPQSRAAPPEPKNLGVIYQVTSWWHRFKGWFGRYAYPHKNIAYLTASAEAASASAGFLVDRPTPHEGNDIKNGSSPLHQDTPYDDALYIDMPERDGSPDSLPGTEPPTPPYLSPTPIAAPVTTLASVPIIPPIIPPVDPPEKSSAAIEPDRLEADLHVHALGAFRVYQGDQLIDCWKGLKGLSIFKYLVLHRSKPISKEKLLDLFWPDAEPEAARRNLHQAIYSLRQTLRRHHPDIQYILFEQDHYRLNPDVSIWTDVEVFENHIQRGNKLIATAEGLLEQDSSRYAEYVEEALQAFRSAETLYLGDLLDEDLYDEWTVGPRARLRNLYMQISSQLADHYFAVSNFGAAVSLYNKLLQYEPCDESAHRGLMRCYVAQKQRHMALRQYQICTQTLLEQLDVPPSPETTMLYEQIVA